MLSTPPATIRLASSPLLIGGAWRRALPAYGLVLLPLVALGIGGVALVETSHHILVKATEGPSMTLLGISYDSHSPLAWTAIMMLLVAGLLGLRRVAPIVSAAYHGAVQAASGKVAK
jgi:hypothetical protein